MCPPYRACIHIERKQRTDILQNPRYRSPASQILSHPFLDTALSGRPLLLEPTCRPQQGTTLETLGQHHSDLSGSGRSLGSNKSSSTMSNISTATRRVPMTHRTNLLPTKSSNTGSKTSSVLSCFRFVQRPPPISSRASSPLARAHNERYDCTDAECAGSLSARLIRDSRSTVHPRRRLPVTTLKSDIGSTTPDLSHCDSGSSCPSGGLALCCKF